MRFLALFEGQPRGFWSRGDHWVAHGGVMSDVRVGDAAPGEQPSGSAAREVRTRISELRLPPASRFFGGIAFGGADAENHLWDGFGEARFQSPHVILEKTAAGYQIQVAVLESGTGPGTPGARASADRVLDELEERLRSPGPTAGESPDAETARVARATDVRETLHTPGSPPAGPGPPRDTPVTDDGDPLTYPRARWSAMVRRALDEISDGTLEKVVLARSLRSDGRAHPLAAVGRLRQRNPHAWTFLFEPEPGRAFIGASPESLAVLKGDSLTATAVAGSAPRGATAAEDRALGQALTASAKDRREHRFVTEGMVQRLGPLTRSIEQPAGPRLLSLAGIHHLETLIRATSSAGVGVLDIVDALHPTAAVCGSPQSTARAFIRRHEGIDRGWYGGPVGWFDGTGDGVFVPALRCALLQGGSWYLFAGAGIVEGSDPDREWEETSLKFETAVGAMGATGATGT